VAGQPDSASAAEEKSWSRENGLTRSDAIATVRFSDGSVGIFLITVEPTLPRVTVLVSRRSGCFGPADRRRYSRRALKP
jgi:hypothetical protein